MEAPHFRPWQWTSTSSGGNGLQNFIPKTKKRTLFMKPTTYFSLMAEFGTGHIPIVEVGKKYFGYDEKKAKTEAAKNGYPFPVFRSGGQKSTWLVDVAKFAEYLDAVKEKAEKQWKETRERE